MMNIDKLKLEAFIDKYGLDEVLDEISGICFNKSEHITVNWQDRATANPWLKAGEYLEQVAYNTKIREVSR